MTQNELIGKINEQLDFINFLTEKGLTDCFSTQTSTTRHEKGQYNNYLPIPIDDKKQMVSYFYAKTFGAKEGLNVFSILYGLKKKYDVQLIAGGGNSFAGVNSDKIKIEAKIFTEPTIQGFETIAHELAHALTARNNKQILLLKQIEKAKNPQQRDFAQREYEGFRREKGSCGYDAIGEIETMTIEKLFVRFLTEEKQYKKLFEQYSFDINQYQQEYEKEHENMAYQRIQTIVETQQTFKKYKIIDYFKDEKEFEMFLSQFPNDQEKERFISDMEHTLAGNAKYSFRYVAGEAISKHWFDKYQQADKSQRKALKKKFTQFWSETDRLDIEQTSSLLCDGKSLTDVITQYFTQSKIHESDLEQNEYEME